jgi:hypothetical protein
MYGNESTTYAPTSRMSDPFGVLVRASGGPL